MPQALGNELERQEGCLLPVCGLRSQVSVQGYADVRACA